MNIIEELMEIDIRERATFKLTDEDIIHIRNYVDHKIPPGGFLTAIICNDLREAAGRADVYNRRKLFEYVQYFYNETPATCWGSEEKMMAWLGDEEK